MHDDPRNLELEAAIAADPDDRAVRQVYADWLLERRDPRGELIALQCAGASHEAVEELLERHGTYLLGPLARHRAHLTWGIGFIRSLDLVACRVNRSAVEKLLQHPSLRFLERLTMRGARGGEALPATLRSLELRQGRVEDLTAFAPVAERLTELTVHGEWRTDGLAFPAVEKARFESFRDETGQSLAAVNWPRLAHLTLARCGPGIAALLARASGLRTLRLEYIDIVDPACEDLATSGVAPQLTELAIWGGLTDRGASVFLDGRFRSLAHLELMDTQVSPEGVELLRASGLNVELAHWQPRDWLVIDG
jgi:uncharacterized protein (TIGR02996 family)